MEGGGEGDRGRDYGIGGGDGRGGPKEKRRICLEGRGGGLMKLEYWFRGDVKIISKPPPPPHAVVQLPLFEGGIFSC